MPDLKKTRKKYSIALLVFLAAMWFCTVVSKSIYVSGLPQVSTENPAKKFVEHNVEAEGLVIQGGEKAVTAQGGLRVENILVHTGDRVEEGTPLLQVDLKDLERLMEKQEAAIQTLRYKISDLETNQTLSEQKKQTLEQRAREDYNRVYNQTGTTLGRAQQEQNKVQSELKDHLDNPVSTTDEASRKKAWDSYRIWQEREKELKSSIQVTEEKIAALEGTADTNTEENAELAAAKELLKSLREELAVHERNKVPEPNFSNEDSAKEGFSSETGQLEARVKSAGNTAADAAAERERALQEAQRTIDDTGFPEKADSTKDIYSLELKQLEAEMAGYQKINKAKGYVNAEATGMVLDIFTGVGERIADTAVMLLTDDSIPFRFKATITKEQKKYINIGDTVTLKMNGDSLEVTLDYLAESKINPETYEAYCNLPQGTGSPGVSGELETTVNGEAFDCVIPANALYKEDLNYFVYLLKERQGILGPELFVQKTSVTVLDQNDRLAALEAGSISQESSIVVNSSSVFKDGDIVRPKE